MPKDRLNELEAAHIALGAARQRLTMTGVSAALGRSKPQLGNVLRGRRGLDENERRRLHEGVVLPGSPPWDALATDRWGWFSRLTYDPLLSPSPPPLSSPQTHVSIDKIVFHAKLVDLPGLLAEHPELKALPGSRGPFFMVHTWRGSYRAFVEHSKADWYSRKRKCLPYGGTLLVKAHVDGVWVTLAKLNVNPVYRSMGRDQARFEISGVAWTLGLAPPLSQMLFAPFIEPRTAQLAEIDVAIDIDAPSRFFVPFQERRSGRGIARDHAVHWNDLDNVGLDFGSRKSKFFGTLYDKRKQVRDLKFAEGWPRRKRTKSGPRKSPRSGVAILPAHAEFFEHIARLEFRFRPKQLGLTGSPGTVLPALLDWISTFSIADLRHLGRATPEAALACEAQRYGFAPQPPTLNGVRSKLAAKKPGLPSGLNHGERCLDLLLSLALNPEWAEQLAQRLHAATLSELVRVSHLSRIEPRAIVEAAIPRLQEELEACLSTRAVRLVRKPAPRHRTASPENAAHGPRRRKGSHAHESFVNALCGPCARRKRRGGDG